MHTRIPLSFEHSVCHSSAVCTVLRPSSSTTVIGGRFRLRLLLLRCRLLLLLGRRSCLVALRSTAASHMPPVLRLTPMYFEVVLRRLSLPLFHEFSC